MEEAYYWVVKEEDWQDTVHKPMRLFMAKKKYKFNLGDKFYLKDGYLGKEKTEDCFYPVKFGEGITVSEVLELFEKLNEVIKKQYDQRTIYKNHQRAGKTQKT